ncbi:hypothetical protein F2Q70_00019490 [Brassica cretica]|uniref:Uncharacterized protein n=1 Tax=Brassica cretica TaxID=69181 RepID=A0A8S9GMA2_BRACR|nr:hypothetical protein F2Q70_00019490 [Brassica cretica]
MTLQHPVHGKIISFRICRVLPQWLTRVTVVGTRKLRWWKADALKLETGEVMETKAQLESELKKTYRESLRNLKLKLPDEYTISSFQLVPETTAGAASLPDSDSDKDTL